MFLRAFVYSTESIVLTALVCVFEMLATVMILARTLYALSFIKDSFEVKRKTLYYLIFEQGSIYFRYDPDDLYARILVR